MTTTAWATPINRPLNSTRHTLSSILPTMHWGVLPPTPYIFEHGTAPLLLNINATCITHISISVTGHGLWAVLLVINRVWRTQELWADVYMLCYISQCSHRFNSSLLWQRMELNVRGFFVCLFVFFSSECKVFWETSGTSIHSSMP